VIAFRETETDTMRHHARTLTCGAALLASIIVAACRGRETMASKSAAAYDEAKKRGIPIAAGEHGGHSAEGAAGQAAAATSTEHASMPGMDHAAMPAMDRSAMPGMKHGAHDMAGMDHSKMPAMKHGAQGMAGMDHSAMPEMTHGSMSGMQHGGSMAAMPGMQHGSQTAAPIVVAPPTSNAAIARTQPAATLRGDEFDAPAPAAVEEAAKAASPPPGHHHDGGGEAP
jgi:uncharacterized protein involved in copper resistance